MNIDFVEPKLPSRRAWVLAALPMVLAIVLWCVSIALNARIEARRAQLAAAERAAMAPPAPTIVQRPPPAYQADAEAALRRAALPEADALATLERVQVVGIQLRSIDVNPSQNIVTVELDAASDEALGDYLDQLNAGLATPLWHIAHLAAAVRDSQPNSGAPSSRSAEIVTLTRAI